MAVATAVVAYRRLVKVAASKQMTTKADRVMPPRAVLHPAGRYWPFPWLLFSPRVSPIAIYCHAGEGVGKMT